MGCMNLRSAVPTIAPMEDLNVSIYALCDPRTDEIRYVGKAIDPQKRLGGHINAAKLGRARHKGEQNNKAKLTKERVRYLRERLANGAALNEVANELKVTKQAVWFAAVGKTWSEAEGPIYKPKPKTRLSDDDVKTIRALSRHGMSNRDLAIQYAVDPSHISKILSNSARRNSGS